MAESRPQSRVKSASGRRSSSEKPLEIQQQPSVKERQKRVSSARLNREKNNSSKKVFPRPGSAEKKERYTSIYNRDFEGTYQRPTEPRPTSPTRRNNPHPSQVCTYTFSWAYTIEFIYQYLYKASMSIIIL